MDNKALFSLSYGVFMLAVKSGDKVNGCIINTCMQVASNPVKIAIACINGNYTCEFLKEGKVFSLSVLDKTCSFATIKHFGMQSGRTVNKFEDLPLPEDINGVPYMGWGACAVLSAHVTESIDVGTHTMFIAELDDAVVLSTEEPMTYAYYHSDVKEKTVAPVKEKKIIGWRCKICGYEYTGADIPSDFLCPLCGHDISDFEPIYE